jgi:Tfp pilus assembly protein PilF
MSELIEVEGVTLKSLFLRGKAYLQKGLHLQAYADLSEALKLDPSNALLQTQVKELRAKYPDID